MSVTVTQPQHSDYTITLSSADQEQLSPQWQQLESVAAPHFFLSWHWMHTWLETCAPDAQLIQIRYQDEIVGLGLFTCHPETRHRWLKSRVIRLHRTGNTSKDQIWIEYNGLLLHPQHQTTAPAALMSYLIQQTWWDEFELGATETAVLSGYQAESLTRFDKWSSPVFGVDLTQLRLAGKSFLDTLSRNTRYQINRSQKRYESQASLELLCLSSPDEILEHWPNLSELHKTKWGSQPEQSGFANPEFVRFHEILLKSSHNNGAIELLLLRSGNSVLGYLYNFVYRNRVYFYLSALTQPTDPKLKPGLLLHTLAIEHYAHRGLAYYDFMGGDARYKASLAPCTGELRLVTLQRPRMRLRLEQLARTAKQHLQELLPQHDRTN